jgi:hypothetical protein
MISERTWDKMGAARRKGKWVGGNLVLGYDVAPQGGALNVNEDEAQRVREIFRMYLEYGSLMPVVGELDRRDWRLKTWTTREGRRVGGSVFTKNKLYDMLTNVAYTGRVDYSGQIYAGEHAAIVDDETFTRVQETLKRNGRRGGRNVRNKYSALLKGIVRCATCDVGMIHTYTKKKNHLYRYYVCVKAHQRGWDKCQTRSVSAQALETAVVEQIRGISRNPAMMGEVLRQLADQDRRGSVESDQNETGTSLTLNKLAEVPLHGTYVMANQNPTILCGRGQNCGIVKALQRDRLGSTEVQAGSATERSRGMLEVGVRLKPDFHACFANRRLRASSIRCWSSGLAGLAARSSSSHFLSRSRRYALACS